MSAISATVKASRVDLNTRRTVWQQNQKKREIFFLWMLFERIGLAIFWRCGEEYKCPASGSSGDATQGCGDSGEYKVRDEGFHNHNKAVLLNSHVI